jgi:hypothetical protein
MVLFNLALTAQIQSELREYQESRAEVSELLTEQKQFNRLFYVE